MTTATRTTETETAKIEITLTREVNDKVIYADGYNIPDGREVYENYEAKITRKIDGKRIYANGKPGDGFFFRTASKYQTMPAGAYARISDSYISQSVYDIAMSMIAELNAEVTKTDEQIALETEEIKQTKMAEKVAEAEAREYAELIKSGMCPKCGTWCYGDCTAN